MNKGVIGFAVGVVVTAAIFYLTVIPKLQTGNFKQVADEQQQVMKLQEEARGLQGQIQTLTTQRDACASKFERVTFFYDIGLLGGETRAWAIPVDVEPKVFGVKRGTFSHYDPKSQTETVHFNPAAAR